MGDRLRRVYSPDEWDECTPWGRITVAHTSTRNLYSRLADTTWGHRGVERWVIRWPGEVLEFVTKLKR